MRSFKKRKERKIVVSLTLFFVFQPFRALTRRHGVDLAFAPMVSAKTLLKYAHPRRRHSLAPLFDTEPGDRPTVFQLSGNDAAIVARAAKLAEPFVDAVGEERVCGLLFVVCFLFVFFVRFELWVSAENCTTEWIWSVFGETENFVFFFFVSIVFKMSEPQKVEAIVRELRATLKIAVCVKIRILPSLEETIAFAQMLERAGCHVLTVHGRTKEQRGEKREIEFAFSRFLKKKKRKQCGECELGFHSRDSAPCWCAADCKWEHSRVRRRAEMHRLYRL